MLTLSEETENLAHRLAEARNVSVDTAVRQALEWQAQAASLKQRVETGPVSE